MSDVASLPKEKAEEAKAALKLSEEALSTVISDADRKIFSIKTQREHDYKTLACAEKCYFKICAITASVCDECWHVSPILGAAYFETGNPPLIRHHSTCVACGQALPGEIREGDAVGMPPDSAEKLELSVKARKLADSVILGNQPHRWQCVVSASNRRCRWS